MQVNVNDLLETLTELLPGLSEKELVQDADCFLFCKDSIKTYNDEVLTTAPFKSGIKGAVKASPLLSLLKKIETNENVTLTMSKEELVVEGRGFKSGVKASPEINTKFDEPEGDKNWRPLPPEFMEAVSICMKSVSREMTRPVMTNIHVSKDMMESTDGYRLTRMKLSKPVKDVLFIPNILAEHLLHTNKKVEEYHILKGWLFFHTEGNCVIGSRYMDAKFPDISKIVEGFSKGVKLELSSDKMKESLEKASVFFSEDFEKDETVQIHVDNGKALIRVKGKNGWFEGRERTRYDGKAVTFSIHPDFLRNVLEHSAVLYVTDSQLKVETENMVHIAMLKANKEW